MKKDKLILFDWGNIVESHSTGYSNINAWNDLLKACGYNEEDAYKKVSSYRLSAISTIDQFKKVYERIKNDLGLSTEYDEFIDKYKYYFNKIDYYKDVRDYELSLKDKCYVGILSNLLIFDKERIDKQLGLSSYDYVFLSFELGVRKPDMEIYEKVYEKLPFKKENILFIDDRGNNIESAKKFGFKTLQATGLELDKIKEACEKFLE